MPRDSALPILPLNTMNEYGKKQEKVKPGFS
jgi:hypothetical protein